MESVLLKCRSEDSCFKADPAQLTGAAQPQRARPSPRKPIHNHSFQKSISQMFSEETGLGRETTHFRYQWPQGLSPHIPCSKMFYKFPFFCNYLSCFTFPFGRTVGAGPRGTQKGMCAIICILFGLAPVYEHKWLTSYLKAKLGGEIAHADFDWASKSLICFKA